MTKLNIRQVNNLTTGTRLAAELPASSPGKRAFVVIGAYRGDPQVAQRVSKSLNVDHHADRYFLRVVEIDRAHMARPDADHFEEEVAYVQGIPSIEALEDELDSYLGDFSTLSPSWMLDYPM